MKYLSLLTSAFLVFLAYDSAPDKQQLVSSLVLMIGYLQIRDLVRYREKKWKKY